MAKKPQLKSTAKSAKGTSSWNKNLPLIIGFAVPILIAIVIGLTPPSASSPTANKPSPSSETSSPSKASSSAAAPPLDASTDPRKLYSYAAQLLGEERAPEAVPYLEFAANTHNLPHAYQLLGELYQIGGAIEKDVEKAYGLFTKAAELKYTPAYIALGYLYESGLGHVEQNYEESCKWYQLAADAGDAVGMSNLAMMYRDGKGVEKDLEKSFTLFERAAGLKDHQAMLEIGNCYFGGIGVDKDYKQALKWYLKSENIQENAAAEYNIANMYRFGVGAKRNLTEAATWYAKASRKGHTKAEQELKNLLYEYIKDQQPGVKNFAAGQAEAAAETTDSTGETSASQTPETK